jgi:hypothetical protein
LSFEQPATAVNKRASPTTRMGVKINIEHPEGKQSGAYCATDRRPMAHGIVSRIGYNFTGHGHQEKAAWTNDRSTRAISLSLVDSTATTP